MSKVVLITGATSGMGKITSLFLAENGYKVYTVVRENADELLQEASERGLAVKTVTLDMQDTQSVKDIVEKEGCIDIPIAIPVGMEAETFVFLEKELTSESFEQKGEETFGLYSSHNKQRGLS